MGYYGIQYKQCEDIHCIARSEKEAWETFFGEMPSPMGISTATRAYRAIGFKCVKLEVAVAGERLQEPMPLPPTKDMVEWVVNDLGELGVEVGGRVFFLYKGHSLVYEDGVHDDGTPMLYRPVGKREFGEVCRPAGFYSKGYHKLPKYTEDLIYTPGLSSGKPEEGAWRPLPIEEGADA